MAINQGSGVASDGPLPLRLQLAYGVGHVMNDLCAACWFSFFLVYLHKVEMIPNVTAGLILLVGQIADACATPTIGFLSDRTESRFGKRRFWLLVGYVLVASSFPFLFLKSPLYPSEPAYYPLKVVWVCMFVIIFQFGWAATQVSHLSLVPELTPVPNRQVKLTTTRFAFTVLSNVTIFVVAWLLLQNGDDSVSASDSTQFQWLAIIAIGIGVVFSALCFFGIAEPLSSGPVQHEADTIAWRDWLNYRQFFQVGMVYMATRVMVNISQTYLPLYLLTSLQLQKTSIASMPLVVYAGQLSASVVIPRLNRSVGRFNAYLVGIANLALALVSFYFLPDTQANFAYGSCYFLGLGCAIILVTSISMEADMIGSHTESGAFVYGALSFLDKAANGLAIMLVQSLKDDDDAEADPSAGLYYRQVLSFIPGSAALVAVVFVATLYSTPLGPPGRNPEKAALINKARAKELP
eukprot:TRINITY_DN9552_c0_g1_i1.p1 TRINITY_DN9552_c0_g1~~TRINITY_DN9552_c0_g1_i1.p1  ORF type:complete len:465 (-),score=58.83 TRINITY_DN9552_c0_g1_i1:48-1442(-)